MRRTLLFFATCLVLAAADLPRPEPEEVNDRDDPFNPGPF